MTLYAYNDGRRAEDKRVQDGRELIKNAMVHANGWDDHLGSYANTTLAHNLLRWRASYYGHDDLEQQIGRIRQQNSAFQIN